MSEKCDGEGGEMSERERHRGVAKYCNGFAAHRLEKTMQSYTRNARVGASMSLNV